MPPKPKNLKLPLSAFSSAPPAPSTAMNRNTIDAHLDEEREQGVTFEAWERGSKRKVVGAIGISRSLSAHSSFSAQLLSTQTIYPIPLPPSTVLPSPTATAPLEFEVVRPDIFDEVEKILDGVVGVSRELAAQDEAEKGGDTRMEVDGVNGARDGRTIVLSNLLPPPLPHDISPTLIMHHPSYQSFTQQISSLSLIPGLCLKLLPPSILEPPSSSDDSVGWWEHEEALITVISNYLIPALDSFGAHRIMFGASLTPLTAGVSSSSALTNPRRDWHALMLKVFQTIKLDEESIGDIMSGTAERVYGLGGQQ